MPFFSSSLNVTGKMIAGCIAFVAFAVMAATLWEDSASQRLAEAQTQQYQSYLLADELRQSSDDLTRLARTYVVTANPTYEQQFLDVLAIRNGQKERPRHYNRIYWDFVAADMPASLGSGASIPLQTLMEEAGFSPVEFQYLRQAQANSDGLVSLEVEAMNAVKGVFQDANGDYTIKGEPNLKRAREIMHSKRYHQYKGEIMAPVQQFLEALEERFVVRVESLKFERRLSSLVLKSAGALLLFMAVILALVMFRRILFPIASISHAMAELTAGGKVDVIPGIEKKDEIGVMARATEAFKAKSAEALQLAEKVRLASIEKEETARRNAEVAETLALTDTLTGLPNRRALMEFAEGLLSQASPDWSTAFLMHFDLDQFKPVNDLLGHAAGDAVLKRVAVDLQANVQESDLVARIGGDEFVLVVTSIDHMVTATALAQRLIDRVSEPITHNGQLAQVFASIGITEFSGREAKTVDMLLQEADLALYEAKEGGRGTVSVFSAELAEREAFTQRLIRDIEPAIDDGQFVPNFQLQVDCVNGKVVGTEVLGRWEHPELGTLFPGQFLKVAEKARLMERIDMAIYERALFHYSQWQKQGIAPSHISVNITARQLLNTYFIERFLLLLKKYELKQQQVMFELVETILLDREGDDVNLAVHRLHDAGFALAIDDFGTGRASLTSLLSVPISLVKIDRAFVTNLGHDPKKIMLTEAILNIARSLNLQVLAEGVECRAECDVLLALGCSVVQGYYLHKPQSATAFEETLSNAEWPIFSSIESIESKAPEFAERGHVDNQPLAVRHSKAQTQYPL